MSHVPFQMPKMSPIPPGQTPPWVFQEPPKYTSLVAVAGLKQNIGQQTLTSLILISFGLDFPPPNGQHVASVLLTPEGAKKLYEALGQNLKDCGMVS